MLPPVAAVIDVERIRDGGSLQASFLGTNGSTYCLLYKLVTSIDADGRPKHSGYDSPMVFERLEYRDSSSIGWRSANEVEISWEHAVILLRQFLQHDLREIQARWLRIMAEVASLKGALPHANSISS
jgi:hypothetical protein